MPKFETALDCARDALARKLRETHGQNRSPEIDEINAEARLPLGSPYCAAGVGHCFHQAGAVGPGEFAGSYGSALKIRSWFRARGWESFNPQDMLGWRGALGGWTDVTGHGHIFFIAKRFTNPDGNIEAVETIEFNTNPKGSREGGGVYSLRRDLAWLRASAARVKGEVWFLNTSELKGGAWWPEKT